MGSTTRQTRWRKLGFSILAVGLFLGAAEVGMQVVKRVRPSAFRIDAHIVDAYTMPAHPDLLFCMPPGNSVMKGVDVRINSLGWRGPDPSAAKAPGTYRMMFFGDSTVFGDGVEEEQGFANLTGQWLAEREARDVEVINAAVPGYSSTQCRLLFEDHVDRLGADCVVFAPMWSDIIVRPWTDADLLRKFSSEGYRFEGRLRRLLRTSAAFSWLEARYEGSRGMPDDRMVAFHSVVNANVQPSAAGDPRVSVAQHRDNLRSMCAHASAREMDAVLVILHCDPTLFTWPASRLNGYHRNYEEAARDFGFPLVDVPSAFPEATDALTALFMDGIHPTAEGHELMAAEVFEAVRSCPRFTAQQGTR